MPIRFKCECGAQFRARDEQAGSPGTCHVCKKPFLIPFPDDHALARTVIPAVQSPLWTEEEAPKPDTPATTETEHRSVSGSIVETTETDRRSGLGAIAAIGTAVLIAVGICGYLTWAHLTADAERAQPQSPKAVVPADSPSGPIAAKPPLNEEPPAKSPEKQPAPVQTAAADQNAVPQTRDAIEAGRAPPAHDTGPFPADKSEKKRGPSVDLRGHVPPVGLSFREVTRFDGRTTETAVGPGNQILSVTTDMVRNAEHLYTVTAVVNGAVTGCRIEVIKGEGSLSFIDSKGQQRTQDRVDELAGEVIVAQKVGSAWKYSLQGKQASLKQEQALAHMRPLFESRNYLPAGKQKPGDTWELDSTQIKSLLGSEISAISGSVQGEFLRIERLGEDLCAVIQYKGTVKGRDEVPASQGAVRTFEMDQEIYLLLTYGLSVKTSGETIATSAGKRKLGGANVEVTTSGRISVKSTTTLER